MKFILSGIAVTFAVILIVLIVNINANSPTPPSDVVQASVPEGFVELSSDSLGDGLATAHVIQHKETKCYYTLVIGVQSVAITQMFEEYGNSVSVPYCE